MRMGESSRDFTDTLRRRSSIFYRENKTITQVSEIFNSRNINIPTNS